MPLYDNTTRAQALTLKLAGVSKAKITSITGIKTQNLNLLYQKAISRGLDPSKDAKLLDIHVQDAARSGRLKKINGYNQRRGIILSLNRSPWPRENLHSDCC
jgi:hypothetical protein